MTTASPSAVPADLDVDTLTSWLLDSISKVLGVSPDEIDIHEQLTEYGMDSRQFVGLTVDLEDLLGRELPPTLLWDNPSIAALARALVGSP